MRIFVTGGAGFIGSHVTKLLLEQGHQVTVFDDLSSGHQDQIDEKVNFIKGDICDQTALENALANHDAVIHMASFIEVGESVKKPVEFGENNIIGTIKLLEVMRKTGVKKMIFSSSACVYGKPIKIPITEDDPIGVQENPYGITKVTMEQFCMLYHNLYNFDVTILRYFNPYGPGELHQPETHAIPNFIQAILNKKPVPLYWKGEQVRDFIYIDDLVEAHLVTLDLSGFNIFNVGTENGVKVMEVIKTLEEILGRSIDIEDLGERPGDVQANFASSRKLSERTGWKARVSLKDGLGKTLEYFKNTQLTS